MKHLDALITKYTSGLITRDELEALVFDETVITAFKLCNPTSPEIINVWVSIIDEYNTYVAEQLGG